MSYTIITNKELYHHGILGQKWGVRRYQNKDGSLTMAGKKRYDTGAPDGNKYALNKAKEFVGKHKKAITIAGVAGILATSMVAATTIGAIGYDRNPAFAASVKRILSASMKNAAKASNVGGKMIKKAFDESSKSVRRGVSESIKEAPKNAIKKASGAVVTGATMLALKSALDKAVGEEKATKIMRANNPKKIDSYWITNNNQDQHNSR